MTTKHEVHSAMNQVCHAMRDAGALRDGWSLTWVHLGNPNGGYAVAWQQAGSSGIDPIVKFGNSKKEIMSRARDIMSVCEAIQKGKK
jgi:hypothetical protein